MARPLPTTPRQGKASRKIVDFVIDLKFILEKQELGSRQGTAAGRSA
jgi:hypothetical protein